MAEPIGAMMKAGKPGRPVDCGNDCPVVSDDQDNVTGVAD
jgi:hypothetical protein